MSEENLPPEIVRLIGLYVRSVGHLEALLLIYEKSERTWTADQLSEAMRSNSAYAGRQMEDLTAAGLLQKFNEPVVSYQYQSEQEFHQAIINLSEFYRKRRVTIINLIYSQPIDRILLFAEAFKLKKD